jgi:hypothetical protein
MRLNEMADLLTSLSTAFERFLKQDAVKDLRVVSDCLRKFSDDSVSAFCDFVIRAREGKTAGSARGRSTNIDKIGDAVKAIQHFLDHRDQYEVAAVRGLVEPLRKLRNAEIEAAGNQVGCPIKGKKDDMISRLENWLVGIKISADQSSFSLSSAGAS